MATVAAAVNPLPLHSPQTTPPVTTTVKETGLVTIDDLIVDRARAIPDAALLAYPASFHGTTDYVDYTARDLDRFVDEAARQLTALGLAPDVGIPEAPAPTRSKKNNIGSCRWRCRSCGNACAIFPGLHSLRTRSFEDGLRSPPLVQPSVHWRIYQLARKDKFDQDGRRCWQ